MSPFILAWRDTEIWLIGPFHNDADVGRWVSANNPKDDPRWQLVKLPIGRGVIQHTIRVDRPDMGPLP